jgi:uncharacterized protein
MSAEVYGRGASFPFAIEASGGIRESAGQRKIEEAMRIILGTQHGERVMRPTFGCNLKRLVFAPNNPQTANVARHYVEEGLGRWEPRIQLVEVSVANAAGQHTLEITITYRIRATQELHSMIYPFYLEQPQP